MAKLVGVYRNDKQKLGSRQLPLSVDENLTMVMDLNSVGFVYDDQTFTNKELNEFMEKFTSLTLKEAKNAFQVTCKDLLTVLGQTVPCVGCRRSVERMFCQLVKSGHPALDPLVVTADGVLTVQDGHFAWPQLLCNLLRTHRGGRVGELVESQLRWKKKSKGRRCVLHSLDSQRARALTTSWRDVWSVMRPQCRDEVLLIEASTLIATLETYLRKHRFCGECRTKVLRAYSLLVEEPDPTKEKGYVAGLYAGIKRCLPDKHIHLQTKTEYISGLISRAEPELTGSRRERHAKTLEIAQEEVLTCLGICVYERLHRIQQRLREEELTCQVLAAVAADALSRNFEVAVELKRGISQLELLYEEITKEERVKQQKREHKKLRRKKRRERRERENESYEIGEDEDEDEEEEEEEEEEENEEEEEQTEPACEHVDDDCSCFIEKPSTPQHHHTERHKLHVLPRRMKGGGGGVVAGSAASSPTTQCPCADCQHKQEKKKAATNINSHPNAGDNSTTTTISNNSCSSSSNNNNGSKSGSGGGNSVNKKRERNGVAVGATRNRRSQPDHHHHNQQQQQLHLKQGLSSLSPCQSCVNAQELLEVNGSSGSNTNRRSVGLVGVGEDCGYSSENPSNSNPSSPDGSEVACSEGFCNHEGDCHLEPTGLKEEEEGGVIRGAQEAGVVSGWQQRPTTTKASLTLQQMLEESCSSDEESYIPAEVVQEFKMKYRLVTEKRQELRQRLRNRFAELCSLGHAPNPSPSPVV